MTTAHAFCRDVLAARPPGPLPGAEPARSEAVALLRAHRLLGLWRASLSDSDRGGDPGGLEEHLDALVSLQALRGELTLEAATRARHTLRSAGFDVLLFKGAGLIQAGVYPDARARALGDADLLIRGGAAAAAVEILEGAGFRPWTNWSPGRDAWLPACSFSDVRAPGGMDVTVDLHWRIPYRSFRSGDEGDGAELWEGADLAAGHLTPEAHALLVAEHFVRHLRVVSHLVGIADMVALLPWVRDPGRLRELAQTRHSLRLLQRVLWFLRAELGVPIDGPLVEAVGVPVRVGRFTTAALSLERLLAVPQGRRQTRIPGLISHAMIGGSATDLLRELARVVYPPQEWLASRTGMAGGGALRRRLEYSRDLMRWATGRGPSPLSPNQEFEGPTGRQ